MKKALTLLIAAVAVSSQAVGFTWKTTSQVSFGSSLVSDLSPASATAHLVYLGADATWGTASISETGILTLGTGDVDTGDTATTVYGKAGFAAAQNSKFTGEFSHLFGTTTTGGYKVTDGDTFGVYLSYVDSSGVTWYNFSEGTYKLSANGDDGATLSDGSFVFNSTKSELAGGGNVTVGGGWYSGVAVPEPATGALALAGIALLLKRRKAAKA